MSFYVDGLNLFRRRLSGHGYFKWLDLERLCAELFPEFDVQRVRYFTAKISGGTQAGDQATFRQQTYLGALAAQDRTVVHFGKYRRDRRVYPAVPQSLDPETGVPAVHAVLKIEEKGSDVNLASHLIIDAMEYTADAFAVLTNDSDLCEPIRLLSARGADVRLVLPVPVDRGAKALVAAAGGVTFVSSITDEILLRSQLPDVVVADKRVFIRPKKWAKSSENLGTITHAQIL